MLREQAVALLRELVANNLIHTNWALIEERTFNSYEVKFNGNFDRSLINPILQKHNLTIKKNKDKRYFVIFEALEAEKSPVFDRLAE